MVPEASFGGLGGRRPPKKKEKRKEKRKKKKRKKRTRNNVKLLHIKCCFFQFFNSPVALKNKKNFAPPKKKLKWRPYMVLVYALAVATYPLEWGIFNRTLVHVASNSFAILSWQLQLLQHLRLAHSCIFSFLPGFCYILTHEQMLHYLLTMEVP